MKRILRRGARTEGHPSRPLVRGPHVRRSDLWRAWARGFFVQSSWNYERMLGLGFANCVVPIAKRLCPDPRCRATLLKRHLEFFNAHPFFSGWAVGAVARLEEQALQERWPDDRPIRVLKKRLAGPLGSIGDRLFWKLWRPLASLVGVGFALVLGPIAILLFLLLYNGPIVYYRARSIFRGYRLGFDVVREMSLRRYAKQERWLAASGLAFTGLLAAFGAQHFGNAVLVGSTAFVAFALFRKQFSAASVLVSGLLLALLAGAVL